MVGTKGVGSKWKGTGLASIPGITGSGQGATVTPNGPLGAKGPSKELSPSVPSMVEFTRPMSYFLSQGLLWCP